MPTLYLWSQHIYFAFWTSTPDSLNRRFVQCDLYIAAKCGGTQALVQPHSNLWNSRDFNYVARMKLVLLHRKNSFLTCSVCDNWLIIGCIATWTNISSPKTGTQTEMSGGKKSYLPNDCLVINFHDAVWITASSSASEMNNNVIAYWQ